MDINQYGEEISWTITDASSGIQVYADSGYLSYTLYYDTICIQNCIDYNFNMYDSYGDGWNGAIYTLLSIPNLDTVLNGTLIDGFSGIEVFEYCDPGPNPTSISHNPITTFNIYPNPFTESTTMEFHNPKNELFYLSMYNSIGKLMRPVKEIYSNRVVVYKNTVSKTKNVQ